MAAGKLIRIGKRRKPKNFAIRGTRRQTLGVWNSRSLGFPDSISTNIRFCVGFSLDTAGGIAQSKTFIGNTVLEPEGTGNGHNYWGMDEFALLYQRYVVNSVVADLHVSNNTPNTGVRVILYANNQLSGSLNINGICEAPMSKTTQVGQNDGVHRIKIRTNRKQMLGKYDEDQTAGTASGIPVQNWFIHVTAKPIDNTSTTETEYSLSLTANVKFFKRRALV